MATEKVLSGDTEDSEDDMRGLKVLRGGYVVSAAILSVIAASAVTGHDLAASVGSGGLIGYCTDHFISLERRIERVTKLIFNPRKG
jgi:hypothetical protein